MAVDEAARYRLHQRLEEVLGPEVAIVLMEHLPGVGWADVATKHDLAALEQRIGLKFDLVDARFERVDLRFDHIDERLDRMDDRFDRMDDRFGRIDDRFDRMDDRFDRMDARFDRTQTEMRTFFVTLVVMIVALFGSLAALVKL